MKNRLITFFLAMGIPFSSLTTQGPGCTGICGSCSYNCTPGIFAVLLLAGKYFYNKLNGKMNGGVMQHE